MAIIGIDLGTTNSACGVWQDGEAKLIENRHGDLLTPSVVGLDGEKNIIVGKTARHRLLTHSMATVAVFKRLMGTKHQVDIGGRMFSATELSAFVLKSLKEDAENYLGERVEEAIISVPAYFNDNQRYATKQAGEIAGLQVRRLINEPTAAALAYGLHERKEGIFAVLDMGGGTFDVSVIEYFEGVMEVHASAGDNYLGGEDFLEVLVADFLARHDIAKERLNKEELQRLYEILERTKCGINAQQVSRIEITLEGREIAFDATGEWFKACVAPLLLRVRNPIEQALRDARIPLADIEEVLLVGGATRMTVFRNAVGKLFGRIPSSHLDPDLAIAMGAAVQAGLKAKEQSLDDVVLTDVCPYTLGTEVVDPGGSGQAGYYLPIIERNSVVPVSRVETLHTVDDRQERVEVNVFQGEHRLVEKNVFLGSIDVKVPRNKAGEESVDLRFSYDMNGLLEVDIKINSSGQTINHVIEQSPGALTADEVKKSKQRLAALKFHPREKEENIELLSRGEHLYSMYLGVERSLLGELLAKFDRVLERQNDIEIAKARAELEELLNAMETGPLQ